MAARNSATPANDASSAALKRGRASTPSTRSSSVRMSYSGSAGSTDATAARSAGRSEASGARLFTITIVSGYENCRYEV